MSAVSQFLAEIDERWALPTVTKVRLSILGCSALMLQADYQRGTKDSDVLETAAISGQTKAHLIELGGSGTKLHERHRLYIDIVANGVPFLPQRPLWRPLDALSATLGHFDLEVLDVVDVVVSKLKRLHANDLSDIEAMIDRDLVPHDRLVERFRAAVDNFAGDARAEDLPKYVRNLHRVERDLFAVGESAIELPAWI